MFELPEQQRPHAVYSKRFSFSHEAETERDSQPITYSDKPNAAFEYPTLNFRITPLP